MKREKRWHFMRNKTKKREFYAIQRLENNKRISKEIWKNKEECKLEMLRNKLLSKDKKNYKDRKI